LEAWRAKPSTILWFWGPAAPEPPHAGNCVTPMIMLFAIARVTPKNQWHRVRSAADCGPLVAISFDIT